MFKCKKSTLVLQVLLANVWSLEEHSRVSAGLGWYPALQSSWGVSCCFWKDSLLGSELFFILVTKCPWLGLVSSASVSGSAECVSLEFILMGLYFF